MTCEEYRNQIRELMRRTKAVAGVFVCLDPSPRGRPMDDPRMGLPDEESEFAHVLRRERFAEKKARLVAIIEHNERRDWSIVKPEYRSEWALALLGRDV